MVHFAELSAVGAALPESEFPEFFSGQPTKGQHFEISTWSKVTTRCSTVPLQKLHTEVYLEINYTY